MGRDPLDYLGSPDATTEVKGKVELATTAETVAGTDTARACTPAGVAAVAIAGAPDASETTKGILKLSTSTQATTGTDDLTAMTPLKVTERFATPAAIGTGTPAAGNFTNLDADGTGTISLDADAASNFSVAGAGIDLTLASAAGRVIVNGEEAAANAITLLSAAGGIDVDAALQINIASSQNAADALRLSTSAGGMDIDAVGSAGEDINITNTGGSIVLSATENAADSVTVTSTAGGIDITAAGAAGEDLDLVCTSGSANLSGGEDIADAVVISAGAGGIDILATGEAGQDIDMTNTGGSVNITATEAVSDAIVISASNGAGGIQLDAGTGKVSVTGASLAITTAATQLQVEGGAVTDFIGQGTLVAGTVTIANTNIATTDRIFVTRSALNASPALGDFITTISAATSFTVASYDALGSLETTDVSAFDYFIVRQL